VRLDTDALITGHDPELPALQLFENNPNVGLAGRIVRGKISLDDFGSVLDNSNQRGKLVQVGKMFTRYFLRKPIVNWKIRELLFRALYNGYEIGEMVFGGAYFFSRIGLEKLRDNGLLPLTSVRKSDFEEDLFFSLLICSVGLTLGDLASGDLPFGCTWSRLPASPETLYQAQKKIIHSTRLWEDLKEEDIRKYFKSKRLSEI
jgi:hypothetical protein